MGVFLKRQVFVGFLWFVSTPIMAQIKPPGQPESQWALNAVNWSAAKVGREVLVAVIDTGVDVEHPALRSSVWRNPGESGQDGLGRDKATNGVDDDKNGFVDDLHGWNFVDNNNQVHDPHGHGTHIAGIIAGHGQMKGVSINSKVMVLRYFDHKQKIDMMESTIRAMRYAIKNGAKIINYSAGGTIPSRLEEEVVKLALKERVLIVAAAGNEATDTDVVGFFPASYAWPHILSVASVDSSLRLARQSNFGGRTVRIAAPGERIVSLLPGGRFGLMSGTSQATAFVTGAAAEVMAQSEVPLDPIQVVDRLMSTGTQLQSLRGRTQFATLLNVKRAWMSRSDATSLAFDNPIRN